MAGTPARQPITTSIDKHYRLWISTCVESDPMPHRQSFTGRVGVAVMWPLYPSNAPHRPTPPHLSWPRVGAGGHSSVDGYSERYALLCAVSDTCCRPRWLAADIYPFPSILFPSLLPRPVPCPARHALACPPPSLGSVLLCLKRLISIWACCWWGGAGPWAVAGGEGRG